MCSCALLKMETLCYSEATYKMTRCHNSDNSVSRSHTLTPIVPGKSVSCWPISTEFMEFIMRLDINIMKLTVNKLSLTLLPFNHEYSPLYALNYDSLKL